MSICLIGFLLVVALLGEQKIYQNLVDFTRIEDFTWRASGSEELVETLNLEEYLNLRMGKQVEQKLNRSGKQNHGELRNPN